MKSNITKMVRVLGFVGAFALVSRADAATDTPTATFQIDHLSATPEGGIRVFPVGGVQTNPWLCPNQSYYEPAPLCAAGVQNQSCLQPSVRETFERILTAAFLAGRPVDLRINGTSNNGARVCGDSNNPAYEAVSIR
jgi:hypothetical protein